MLRDARDIAAAIAYGKQLDRLRDEQLRRALDGDSMTAEEFRAKEDGAVDSIRAEYFNLPARHMIMTTQAAAALSDAADFAKRQTLLMEEATLESHRLLCGIPFVGQPGFDDPEPPAPLAAPATGDVPNARAVRP